MHVFIHLRNRTCTHTHIRTHKVRESSGLTFDLYEGDIRPGPAWPDDYSSRRTGVVGDELGRDGVTYVRTDPVDIVEPRHAWRRLSRICHQSCPSSSGRRESVRHEAMSWPTHAAAIDRLPRRMQTERLSEGLGATVLRDTCHNIIYGWYMNTGMPIRRSLTHLQQPHMRYASV